MKLLFLCLILSPFAFAHEKTVTVSGECSQYVTSDRGSLTMTVDNLDKSVKVANTKTSETYNDLKKELEKLSLKDVELETTEYSVNEQKDWENNKMVSKGFRSRMGLKISTSEIAKLGDVIVIANKLSITEVGALQSYVSDQKMKSLELDCLKEASLDAKKKAETLAKTLGAKLDGILTINEAGVSLPPSPQPVFMKKGMRGMEAMSMAAPEISAAKEKYTLNIQATFKLE